MENNAIIEIKNLKKYYKNVKAVDDVSFNIKKGELFAFLGVNGAGKSTTISVLSGVIQKDQGIVKIDGLDVETQIESIKPRLGIVFQNSVLDKQLSAYDNFKSRASLYGIFGQEFDDRVKELTEIFELEEFINRPLNKLSGGQKRRVDIARALIHQPKILFLDEPTTGLDPMTRKKVWDIVNQLRKSRDLTVFLTTHYMEEAENADQVVIIDHGKIIASGTPLELKNKFTKDCVIVYGVSEDEIKPLKKDYEVTSSGIKIFLQDTKEAEKLIVKHPKIFQDFEVVKGKMDDVFLNATGKTLEGDKENAKS